MAKHVNQLGWWIFFLISALYAVFSFYIGGLETLSLLGIEVDAPHRAAPILFVVNEMLIVEIMIRSLAGGWQ